MENQLRRLKPGKLIFIGLLGLVLTSASVSWAQIVVTTLADSGPGSLRQAILDANADGVATTINFDPVVFPPPPSLPGIIGVASQLQSMTGDGDTVDATGAGVVIDGSALAAPDRGLTVRRSNITVRGLTVQYFPGDGIRVDAQGPSAVVTGVVIDGNTIVRSGSRGIRVSGGIGPGKEVSATVINNTVTDSAVAGILVSGNLNQDNDPGGNTVTALVDNNTVKRSRATIVSTPGFGGDGIDIVAGVGLGSNNDVAATVSNNDVFLNRDDGIVAVGCGLLASGENNTLEVTIINNKVSENGTVNPELVRNTGIVVSGSSREEQIGGGEAASTCKENAVQFEISGNTVNGNRTQNISVSGGPGTSHNIQGIVAGNSAKDSPEGDGISITGGRGTGTLLHDIAVSNNQVTGNVGRGIIISGGTETISAVLTNIDILSNSVRSNGDQGILVTGGTLSENATISDILISGNASNNNGNRGIQATRGTALSAFPPVISLAGVTNNTANGNTDDGILIASSIPGSGATPVSGNRADGNHVDGIDLNSTGYVVSNNTASRNTLDGINLGGNSNGGGNVARNNGSCNTPLPGSCL
jgi:Right handed beta helix region